MGLRGAPFQCEVTRGRVCCVQAVLETLAEDAGAGVSLPLPPSSSSGEMQPLRVAHSSACCAVLFTCVPLDVCAVGSAATDYDKAVGESALTVARGGASRGSAGGARYLPPPHRGAWKPRQLHRPHAQIHGLCKRVERGVRWAVRLWGRKLLLLRPSSSHLKFAQSQVSVASFKLRMSRGRRLLDPDVMARG